MTKKKNDDAILVSRAKPSETAEKFRETVHPTLIYVEEDWLVYEDGAYKLIKNDAMRAQIRRFLRSVRIQTLVEQVDGDGNKVMVAGSAPFNPKKSDVSEVYEALVDICLREVKPPAWLDDQEHPDLDPANIISLKNGLLEVTTCVLHPHTSAFFTRTALPINFEEKPGEPEQFLKFLREITSTPDDPAMSGRQTIIDLIQEMMGYLISVDTEQEVVFYLLGKSRGGKGTLMKIMAALIGNRNLAAPTIRSFAGDFWAWGLMDKSVAMVTDMAISDRESVKLAANHVNMLSGRDPVDVNRKFKDPIMAFTLPTRVVMAGNAMPDFGDHAEALANRLLVIPYDVTFKGREDKGLARRIIKDELPAILLWALKGLRRLRGRGHFEEPPESIKAKRLLMVLANPVRGFVEDSCIVGADCVARKDRVYSAYQVWCHATGIRNILSLANFSQRLYEAAPAVRDYRPRVAGEQVPHFLGLQLKGGNGNDPRTFDFDAFAEIQAGIALGLTWEEAVADAKAAQIRHESGL